MARQRQKLQLHWMGETPVGEGRPLTDIMRSPPNRVASPGKELRSLDSVAEIRGWEGDIMYIPGPPARAVPVESASYTPINVDRDRILVSTTPEIINISGAPDADILVRWDGLLPISHRRITLDPSGSGSFSILPPPIVFKSSKPEPISLFYNGARMSSEVTITVVFN